MPRYDFAFDDGSIEEVCVEASCVKQFFEREIAPGYFLFDDGRIGLKLMGNVLSAHFGKNHAPHYDAERAESVRAFHEPCAFAGGKSMAEFVKDNNLKTMGDSTWV